MSVHIRCIAYLACSTLVRTFGTFIYIQGYARSSHIFVMAHRIVFQLVLVDHPLGLDTSPSHLRILTGIPVGRSVSFVTHRSGSAAYQIMADPNQALMSDEYLCEYPWVRNQVRNQILALVNTILVVGNPCQHAIVHQQIKKYLFHISINKYFNGGWPAPKCDHAPAHEIRPF